ncbi:MAG: carboxypeptidase-like regulatory domain-containing protein [Culturomica sp.]|jgi:hypothetical protein|nr:carboxypeptidase-like regulatory domain-containing protein [Culturomica sp.]
MKIFINIIFLFAFVGALSAQESDTLKVEQSYVRLSGIVFDSEDYTPLQNVTCREGRYISTTDRFGRFVMNAEVSDTIHFTYVGYSPFTMVVPDTLANNEYIIAVSMSKDTIMLGEVVVVRRYGAKKKFYSDNAINNMSGTLRDAYKPRMEMTKEENQARLLDEYAASTNKGHVKVGFGVGTGSWSAYQNMKKKDKKLSPPPSFLSMEEMDLIKMVLQYKRNP